MARIAVCAVYVWLALTIALATEQLVRHKRGTRYRRYEAVFGNKTGRCSGFINSPNFPQPYDNDDSGYYSIRVPANNRVTLKVQIMDLESSKNCRNDYIAIYDGSNTKSRLLKKLCGQISTYQSDKYIYTASSNDMYVVFKANGKRNGFGFQLVFYSKPMAGNRGSSCIGERDPFLSGACNGGYKVVGRRSGAITSPKYPSYYPASANCGWIIDVSAYGSRMKIKWTKFILENSENCLYDWMTVRDPKRPTKKNAHYCYRTPPSVSPTGGQYFFVTFHSDTATGASGFKMNFKAFGSPVRSLNQPPMVTESRQQATTKRPKTRRPRTKPPATKPPATKPPATKRPTIRRPITQSPATQSPYPRPSYLVSYQLSSKSQRKIINAQSGYIMSPGYGRLYPRNCRGYTDMTLGTPNTAYKFTAEAFHLEKVGKKCVAKLRIIETGPKHKRSFGPYCGHSTSDFGGGSIVAYPPLRIRFTTSGPNQDTGFKLSFKTVRNS